MDMMSSKADPYLVLTVDQALHTKERERARVYTVSNDHWALLKLCIYEVYTNTVSLSLSLSHTHTKVPAELWTKDVQKDKIAA
jgi:hypothetical protein